MSIGIFFGSNFSQLRVTSELYNAKELNLANSLANKERFKLATNTTEGHFQINNRSVNNEKKYSSDCDNFISQKAIEALKSDLFSEDSEQRILAIEFFGKYGSDEANESLINVAVEEKNPRIKSAAILSSRWDKHPDRLIDLATKETDPDVKESIISAMDNSEFDQQGDEELNQYLLDVVSYESDGEYLKRILSHLYNDGPDSTSFQNAFSVLLSRNDLPIESFDYMADLAQGSPELLRNFPSLRGAE